MSPRKEPYTESTMKHLLTLVLCLPLVGCIHAPQGQHLLGATQAAPPSPAAVASCEKTRTWHNTWTLGGMVLGGVAGAGGSVDAVDSNKGVQTAMGITAAVAGVLAVASTAAGGIEADIYSTNNCAAVLQANANIVFAAAPAPGPVVSPAP